MVPLVQLTDGRQVFLEGEGVSAVDALEIAATLLKTFAPHHPRIEAKVVYEWKPLRWADCPHTETFEEALEELSNEERR